MKTLDYLHLDSESTKKTVDGLQELLANLQLYYTNLRGFHWNVKGEVFYSAHERFEGFYDDTAAKVDEVAERILMLGGVPAHNYSDYLKVLIGLERRLLETASEGDDEGTVTLIGDFISGQEKNVWMLTSLLS